jgi:transposase-like protein
MIERNGEVRANVVDSTNSKTLKEQITNNVESGTNIYTDSYRAYKGLKKDYTHEKVKHSVGEYVRGMIHTNGIESFWALLKRGYYGIYHHMSKKHLQKYVNEFARRHNTKELTTLGKISKTIINGIGIRLTYKGLINV